MTDKAAHPGWVVLVPVPAQGSEPAKEIFFNVAIADPQAAAAAANGNCSVVGATPARTIRPLRDVEIAFLHLKVGEAKPA